jgi:transcriptional regulator with XRE-family HTH domain
MSLTLTIGQIIKKLRKEHNLTQEKLAEKLHVTFQAVSKWENGTGLPDISQVVPLAKVFGVNTDVLFGAYVTIDNEKEIVMETTNTQKLAVIMIVLGADYAAKIYKHLDDKEIEEITLEVAEMAKSDEKIKILGEFIKMLVDRNPEVAIQLIKTLL